MPDLRRLCLLITGTLLAVSSIPALATDKYDISDAPHSGYGWIPEYQKLYTRLGGEYFSTGQNFLSNGALANLPGNNSLADFSGFLEAEYGIAEDWSVFMHLGMVTSTLSSPNGLAVLSNAGFQDLHAAVKWNVKATDPIVTLEIPFTIPIAQSNPTSSTQIVLGDGSFETGLQIQTGHRSGAFLMALSPGFLFRSGGYAYQFFGDAAVQIDFLRGYLRAFAHGVYSVGSTTVADAGSVNYTGGSYALQSGAPIGFLGGGKIGVRIINQWFLEATLWHGIWGENYPDAIGASISIFNSFDFFHPLPVKKVKEVPFEEDQSEFYKNK